MKIKSVEIENFKLFGGKFDEIENISDANLILFNGPNGYGKTTVFDAIELVLTGEIKRIGKYNDDLGINKKEKHAKRLLVADPSKEASVSMIIGTEKCELKLQRIYEKPLNGGTKKPAVENNPHKTFEIFKRKIFVNEQEIMDDKKQEEILKKYHLNDIAEFYDKCCFLSQDEHLLFLKQAIKDKAKALDFMFKLPEEYEKKLTRINNIISSLYNANTRNDLGHLKILKNQQEELEKAIEQLKGEENEENNNAEQDEAEKVKLEYHSLFRGKLVEWDKKSPSLNQNEYNEAIASLDRLCFYAQHQEDCQNYIFNDPIKKLIKPFMGTEDVSCESNLLEYTYRYFSLLQKAEDYETKYNTKKSLEQLKENLEKRTLNGLNWEIILQHKLIEEEDSVSIKETIEEIDNLKKSQGITASMITTINEARSTLIGYTDQAIQQSVIDDSECPLCGAPYDSKADLDRKISEETEKLQALNDETSVIIQERVEKIYTQYLNAVLTDTTKLLQDSITEEMYQKLREVKTYKVKLEEINNLLDKINIHLPQEYNEDITEIAKGYNELIKNIQANLKRISNEMEEQLSDKKFADDYDRYYDKDEKKFLSMSLSALKEKQSYVREMFYDSKIKMMNEKQNELSKVKERYDELQGIYEDLCKYRDAINEGVKDYKRKVICDIEPLLHVYTAKILQQKFNGRSIFILTNDDMTSLQLVNSATDKQDVLYNMSSGQLAAVSLSFLLCMNQVYAQQQAFPFILIDDPIQTIDDVNMVGLVDILRFEFRDAQIFISTHEQKFEWYLKYKYEKANKKIASYNMKNVILQAGKV